MTQTDHSILDNFQSLAAIACTPKAIKLLQPVCKSLGITLWIPASCEYFINRSADHISIYTNSLKEHLTTIWPQYRGFIFCLATGAVVRLIAPFLEDKTTDPAIVVVDQLGQFVISLSSGHLGGADRLTQIIATYLYATPILTGSAHALQLPSIDTLGLSFGWKRGRGDWNQVAAVIARNEPVEVIQEVGLTLWQNNLPVGHQFYFDQTEKVNAKARIWIGFTERKFLLTANFAKIQWHPRVLWVGVGCERGTSQQVIASGIDQVFQNFHLAKQSIAGIGTIDIKADEIGLIELCKAENWPLRTFSAEDLGQVNVPTPSAVVHNEVGTPSVAEAAAILAAEQLGINREIEPRLLIKKQIFRLENEPGAVTIAVAVAPVEYTGRDGKLFLIGVGPGDLSQITPAAKVAINQADVVIGYSLYLNLISSLFSPNQIIDKSEITQERYRAKRAISLAKFGFNVAVVSSGDCGIYGMAGLVLEQLQKDKWDGKKPSVQVFPGISALQAAAARVGAPLMHDFCAISLSDLLTPWDVIEKRLKAAAMADFVTAIYNPKSQSRLEQIVKAQQIFLEYRHAETPVSIVRSAFRDDEEVTITTLGKMLDTSIDMLTVLIIGNQSTRTHGNWMITPRGYMGFSDPDNET